MTCTEVKKKVDSQWERCGLARGIKFRAKRVDNSEWVYGDLQHELIARSVSVMGSRVAPETVGQYTGLYDKNGVEIYEGDVVRADMDFGPGGYAEQIESIYWDEGVGGWQFNYFDKTTIEIIGNIHDNPELIEREK